MAKSRRNPLPPPGFPDLPMLFTPLAGSAFVELGVGVSTAVPNAWRALNLVAGIHAIEVEHGADMRRHRYNQRSLAQARATRELVRGELFGLRDLFMPLVRDARVRGVLVTGPFADAWPTSEAIRSRWFDLTRTRARASDPAFSRYVETVLGVLTLEGPLLGAFEHLVQRFAALSSGHGNTNALATEMEALRLRLLEARFPEDMWEAARSMVDERSADSWLTGLRSTPLAHFGLRHAPRHVVVGLLLSREPNADPVSATLASFAFQRACTQLARNRGLVVCGRVGDRGVTLLADYAESGARARTALVDLATRVGALARRFGFSLHSGIALAASSGSLIARYREALAAAEKALTTGVALEFAAARSDASREGLRQLRRALARGIEQPGQLVPRFDRYIEAVLAHTGHRLEPTREQLQIGLETLCEPLIAAGVLEPKSFDDICGSAEQDRSAQTVLELVQGYRRVLGDVERAVGAPTLARHERNTRRALAFIQEHLDEEITRAQVARVAGFAPDYFSRLLKHDEGHGFEGYLQRQRLERARYLLTSTTLSVANVARASGFKSRTTFQRLFRATTGSTPAQFRGT